VLISSDLLSTFALAKPGKVGGVNVPFGRIPREIQNNQYPRTYDPNIEKLGSKDRGSNTEPGPSLGRIESESEPPNHPTEINEVCRTTRAGNPPSPVRVRQG